MSSPSQNAQKPSRWLFGPLTDSLFGCGGAYLIVFLLLAGAGNLVPRALPHAYMPLLVLFTSIPHYGATLLRVYERDSEVRRYRVFAVWITLAIYAWFVVGVYDRVVGSLLLTLYFTWSPWHYSGQNYGIALMFLSRRGVAVPPGLKRWLHASFVLSFVLAFLGMHTVGSADAYAPGSFETDDYAMFRLGIPVGVSAWCILVAAIGYVGTLAAVGAGLLRQARWRDLAPAAAVTGLQGLWFSLPVLSRATGWLDDVGPISGGVAGVEYAFLWVAVGHAVQYLWITSYYAMGSDAGERPLPYLAKAVVAGGAAFGLPLLLFGPDMLGVRGYEAGLGLLIASAVNLHHFVLDGAIWKLRDGRIARVLLRPEPLPAAVASSDSVAWGRWLRRGLGAAGLVYAVTFAYGTLEYEHGVRGTADSQDFARMRLAASRLRWIGRDDAVLHHNLAVGAFRAGELETAREELERSLALQETTRTWVLLGIVRQRQADARGAADAYQRALELDPAHLPALTRAARAFRELGEPSRARDALERALAIAPEREDLREQLASLDGAS